MERRGPPGRQVTDYPLEQSALLLPKAISNALAGLELSVDQAGLALTEIL